MVRGHGRVVGWLLAASVAVVGLAACGGGDGSGGGDVAQRPQEDGLSDLGGRDGGGDAATGEVDGAVADADDASSEVGPPGDVGAEVDADAGSEGLVVPADQRQTFCTAYCATIGQGCGYGAVGGSDAACRAACGTLSGEDGWWLGNYACYAGTCDAAACALDGPALPEQPACTGACLALDACDLLPLFQLPEDQPAACRAACTGTAAANPAFVDPLPCVLDALDPTCDQTAFAGCYGGSQPPGPVDPTCAALCAPFYNPADPMYCPPASGLYAQWPDANTCATACTALGSYGASIRFVGCAQAAGCGDVSRCETPPAADAPECAAACASIFGLCGTFGGINDQPTCSSYCTGTTYAYQVDLDPDAGACVAGGGTCPVGEEALGALFYGCLIQAPEACVTVCESAGACTVAAGQPFDGPGCRLGCLSGVLGTLPAVTQIATCMEAAGEDCGAVLACAGGTSAEADPLCEAACARATDVCGEPEVPGCAADCTAALAAAPASLAEVICRLAAPCDAQATCEGAAELSPPDACLNACTAAPAACGAYEGACPSACVGALAATSLSPDQAFCAVGALSEDCDPTTLETCAP